MTPLHCSLLGGKNDVAAILLDMGADTKLKGKYKHRNHSYETQGDALVFCSDLVNVILRLRIQRDING